MTMVLFWSMLAALGMIAAFYSFLMDWLIDHIGKLRRGLASSEPGSILFLFSPPRLSYIIERRDTPAPTTPARVSSRLGFGRFSGISPSKFRHLPSQRGAVERGRGANAALSLTEDGVPKSRVIPRDVILGSKIVILGSKIAIFGSI